MGFIMKEFQQKIIIYKLLDLENRWKIKIWDEDVTKMEDKKIKHANWLEKEFEKTCKNTKYFFIKDN